MSNLLLISLSASAIFVSPPTNRFGLSSKRFESKDFDPDRLSFPKQLLHKTGFDPFGLNGT